MKPTHFRMWACIKPDGDGCDEKHVTLREHLKLRSRLARALWSERSRAASDAYASYAPNARSCEAEWMDAERAELRARRAKREGEKC